MIRYLGDSLAGAFAVMRGRREGLGRLDLSIEGFWRSFAAILLLIPFAVLAMLSQRKMIEAMQANGSLDTPPPTSMANDAMAFALDWMAFPIVFAMLARPLGVASRYVPFIVARNWGAVVLSSILALVHVAHLAGLLPSSLMPIPLLAMLATALWFAYVIARTVLETPVATTIGVVTLDFLITLVIWSVAERLA